jgi:hypothetical protein
MDLVRMILMRLESSPGGWAPRDLHILTFTPQEISYHAHIMTQEGLIEGTDGTSSGSAESDTIPRRLTWKGHEFLDLARDHARWNRAKAIIAKVDGAPIAVWTKVLTDLTLQGVDTAATKVN